MIPETDEVLVNRNGTTYKTTAENMANLEDNDLMLVNRDGVTYTVTGEEIKDSIQSEEAVDISSVVLTQNQVNADRYTSNSFTSTVNFQKDPFPPPSIEMTAKVEGVLGLEASTDVITSNDYVGTANSSVPLQLASDQLLSQYFEAGDEVITNETYSPESSVIASAGDNPVSDIDATTNITNKPTGAAGYRNWAVSTKTGTIIYQNSQDIRRSTDGGKTWVNISYSLNGLTAIIYLEDYDRFFGIDGGAKGFYSNDDGLTWQASTTNGASTSGSVYYSCAYHKNTGTIRGTGNNEYTWISNDGGININDAGRLPGASGGSSGPTVSAPNAGYFITAREQGGWNEATGNGGWGAGASPGGTFRTFAVNDNGQVIVITPSASSRVTQFGSWSSWSANTPVLGLTTEICRPFWDGSGWWVGDNTGKIQYSSDGTTWLPTALTPAALNNMKISHIDSDGSKIYFFIEGASDAIGYHFNGTQLTLTDETDIELFQNGDLVQLDETTFNRERNWSESVTVSPSFAGERGPANAFDYDTTNSCTNNAQTSGKSFITIIFDPPIQANKVEIVGGNGSGDTARCWVNGSDQGIVNLTVNNLGTENYQTIYDGDGGTLSQIEVADAVLSTSSNQCGFSSIKVDGKRLVDRNAVVPTDAKVLATDVSAKTITVDGGNWDTTNQSQVWSAALTCPEPWATGKTPEYAFNGNVGDVFTTPDDVADVTFTPEVGIPYTTSIEVYMGSTGGTGIILNDSITVGINPGSWTKINGSGVLNKLVLAPGDKVTLGGIKVDGKLLVDKVNDSSTWSGGLSLPDGIASGTYTNQFDGNPSTYANPASASNSWSWLCPETIVLTENIKLKPPFVENFNYTWSIGGNSGTSVTITDTGWYELQGTEGRTVSPGTPLVIGANTSSVAPKFTGMMVNGVLLVDQGVRNFGDTKVSTVSPKQGQGTISDITGSDVTINPYTDNCFKEGQYLTHATPKPILITPQTDDITDVTGNVLTFSGDKDLLNFAAGDAVTMVNADGSAATYNATTSAITNVDLQSITGSSSGFTSGGANLYNGTGGTASTSNGSGTRAGSISFNPALPAGTSQISYYEYNGSSSSTRPMTVTISYDDATSDVINTQISAGNTRVHPVDSAKQIKSISWSAEVANESLNINQLKLDLDVIDLSVYDQTVLTFTDNTNLQYWKDGEVVGGYQGTISGTNSVGTGIFNFATFPYENKTYTQIFDPPVPCTSFQFRARPTDGQDSMESKISINGGGFTSIQQGDIQTNYNVPSGLTSLTYKFGVQAGNTHFGPGFGQLRFDGGDLDDIVIVDSTTFTWKVVTVIGNPDLVNNTITVSGGSWSNGDTLTKSISGTGTVLTTNPQNSTMTLSTNNEEWVDGYYVQTPERPAIGQIGYLKFGSNGNVTGVTLSPQPAVVMANPNPVLTFPAQFGTGETPDTELPYPTSLQTTITASNTFIDLTVNTSTASSNVLFPATTTFLGPASGTSRYTGTGVAQLTANLTTFSGREAAANTDPTDVQGALAAKQTEIDDYIAGL